MANILYDLCKPAGYFHCFDPDPGRGELATREGKTMTCAHCGVVRFIRRDSRVDLCGRCFLFICETCVAIGSCDPIEEKLRRAEEQALEDERRYGVSKPFNPYRLPE